MGVAMSAQLPAAAADAATATSFASLFADRHEQMVRLAWLLCGNQPDAQDAVADALVKVWRRLQRGPVDDLDAYTRRAVVNTVNSRLRRRYLERWHASWRVGDDRGQRAVDEHVADRDTIWQAVLALPARQRACVVLRYYEDLPEAAVADVLGIAVGTVKSNTSRGLAKLADVLTAQEVGS